MIVQSVVLAGCAAPPAPAPPAGFGMVAFALTGALPDVQSLTLGLYDGAAGAGKLVFDSGCTPYVAQNLLSIGPLKTGSGYSLVAILFQDGQCQAPRFIAFRGAIAVTDQSETASQARPYYVQPYELGRFTGLAQVNPTKALDAGKTACTQDVDCKSVHPNATCDAALHACTIDHLFPLNSAVRRAFPLVRTLDDGRVAITGGLTTQIQGDWSATNYRLEIFDPDTGLFGAREVSNSPGAVGMAEGVSLAASAFAQVGGTAAAKINFVKGASLATALQTKGCAAGPASSCKVSGQVARVETRAPVVAQLANLDAPLAFPIVSRVRTPEGDRVLIAGGAKVPLKAGGDSRSGQSVLCQMDGGQVECTPGPTMKLGRSRAATACLSGNAVQCTQVLVLGGRKAPVPPLAEIYDADKGEFVAALVAGEAVPDLVHGGQLLPLGDGSWMLVGASKKALFLEDGDVATGADLDPLRVTVDTTTSPPTVKISALPLGAGAQATRRLMATAVGLNDRSVLLMGGLDSALQPRADAIWFAPDGSIRETLELSAPRFGAGASLIGGHGPLAGCVLLAGGFTWQNSALVPQNHVEVFCPRP